MTAWVKLIDLDGIVNLDKPIAWSSAKAVTAVRSGIGGRGRKVGHAGTLDPSASGVLVLLVGRATCLSQLLMDAGKEYVATVRLGATSSTGDREGRIEEFRIADCGFRNEEEPTTDYKDGGDSESLKSAESVGTDQSEIRNPKSEIARPPERRQIEEALARFVGNIQQRPPAHSALMINGKRAYKLARRGRPVQPPMRTIHVQAIDLLDYHWPDLQLRIVCGRGTYVRALARDIGQMLHVGGYLAGLRRTRVGPFRIENAVKPARCLGDNLADWLLPLERVSDHLPADHRIRLDAKQTELIGRGATLDGRRIPAVVPLVQRQSALADTGNPSIGAVPLEPLAAFDPAGRLIAICRLTGDAFHPLHVLRPLFGPIPGG